MGRWIGDWWFRLRALLRRRRMDREMEEEIAFHLEMEERKYLARGLSPDEARRLARVRFGGDERFKEQVRRAWGTAWLHDLGGDMRFAARQLRKNPTFSGLVILTLALGIGGTIALFSVVDGLVIRPMPVRDEGQVMVFWYDFDWRGVEYDFARERVKSFQSLAAYSMDAVTLRTDAGSSLILSAIGSSSLFDVLGVRPFLGRTFEPGEDRPGAAPVIVLSYGVWQRDFGADRTIVGRSIDIDGRPTTVVGVMPKGFYFPTPEAKAWLPLDLDPASHNYQSNGWLVLVGRLRSGVSQSAIHQDLRSLADAMGRRWSYPAAWDKTKDPHVTPLRQYVLGDVRPTLLLLLSAVGLVLLMACANVAGLILTRTTDRAGEMGVRTALGAGRGRLARQVLTESVLLGLVAGLVGTALAAALFRALVASLPLQAGFAGTLSLDWPALVVALGVSVLTGCLISLAPLRGLLAKDLSGGLAGRSQAGTASGSGRLQASLVTVEVLLAVVLTTGAALLVRSVEHLRSLDPGFSPAGVLTLDLLVPEASTDSTERDQMLASVVERTRALPGVTAAGLINRVPARDGGWQATVAVADRPDLDGDRRPNAFYRPVTPETFQALGATIVEGRGILPSDGPDAARVAVVNQSFARRFWGDGDPIGRVITDNGFGGGPVRVVGVVKDIAIHELVGPKPLAVYYPWAQTMHGSAYGILVAKTSLDATGLAGPIRALTRSVDPRMTIGRVATMNQVLDNAMAEPLHLRFFLGLFSLLGLAMGSVGVYGVVSWTVQRRRSEMGIRLALGAGPSRLVLETVRGGMMPVLSGVVLGLFVSWLTSSVLAGFLFGVTPDDGVSFASAAAILVLTGMTAALLPAVRAGRTDPSTALRAE